MNKVFFLIVFSVITGVSTAQSPNDVDSLRQLLNQNKQTDSDRVKTILNLANILIYTNPDSAMKHTNEAMQLSEKIKWNRGLALCFRQKGYVYYISSDYVQAMDYYVKALKAGESMHNKYFNATIDNNIANIYADLKNYKKALEYYSRYLSISREIKSKTDEMNGLINLGDLYTEINNLPLGLDYFNNALAIASETDNKRIGAAILNNIGEIYIKQQDYPTAVSYLQRSLKLSDETGNQNTKATTLNSLAEVSLNAGDYQQAEHYALASLSLAKQLNDLSWQANAYQTLSKTYEQQSDFAKALENYKQSVLLTDSVLNTEKKQDIVHLEMQYAFDKKEAALKAANDKKQALALAEINRQKVLKNASMGIGAILIAVAIAGIILYKRRKDVLAKKREAEFNMQVASTELKALRAQMNPHFIFNSLNSINDYIRNHDTTTATLYTTRFARLMRMILENSEQKEIPLLDDLKALELYMQLESMRMQNKFSYEIKVDDTIDQENTLIPPLILQPFVENSIWHGISGKPGVGKILISIKKEGNMIHCIVEDNGIGIHELANTKVGEEIMNKKSFGMKITKARIDIINTMKKSNAAVTMSNAVEGTRIEIKLPEELAF